MSGDMIVKHCSPTLAGLKTGNMFNCGFDSGEELRDSLRLWNRALGPKGVRILPLRVQDGRALIYVYRPLLLHRDLQEDTACRLLEERGYAMETPGQCVLHLMKRLKEGGDFPHEIGLFLGYPPEDVYGFIENRAEGCKCVGCWKVYGDEEAARKRFAKFKKCTTIYCARHAEGRTVERLTVAG